MQVPTKHTHPIKITQRYILPDHPHHRQSSLLCVQATFGIIGPTEVRATSGQHLGGHYFR
jgi:hypothetical protein